MSDTKKHDDGGQAFPFVPNEQQMLPNGTWDQNGDPGQEGMTMHDVATKDILCAMIIAGQYTGNLEKDVRDAASYADECIAEKRRRENYVPPEHLGMSVWDLGLLVRAGNALMAEGINTVGDIINKSEFDLLRLRGFGEMCLQDVKRGLREMGLHLKGAQ